jgi:hypothetical protein
MMPQQGQRQVQAGWLKIRKPPLQAVSMNSISGKFDEVTVVMLLTC